jgi:hypothetical protein
MLPVHTREYEESALHSNIRTIFMTTQGQAPSNWCVCHERDYLHFRMIISLWHVIINK